MTIDRLLEERAVRTERALEVWRSLWPEAGPERTLEPESSVLEYFLAELSDEFVEAAIRETHAQVPPGGRVPSAHFISICAKERRTNWAKAARSIWLVELACPNCGSGGLLLYLRGGRPGLTCADCGTDARVSKARLLSR